MGLLSVLGFVHSARVKKATPPSFPVQEMINA
jgi:hypothetical protein